MNDWFLRFFLLNLYRPGTSLISRYFNGHVYQPHKINDLYFIFLEFMSQIFITLQFLGGIGWELELFVDCVWTQILKCRR